MTGLAAAAFTPDDEELEALAPCLIDGCVALVEPGSKLCTVHGKVTVRGPSDAPIHCDACGKLIRIGRRWVVRDEGAFHCRVTCLNMPPENYAIHGRSVDAGNATH
jgi:hypothetical protein